VEERPESQFDSLRSLVEDVNAGRVEALLILGGNPVYTAPADLNFAAALQRVPLRVHLSLYQDETSRRCHWHLPEAHFLEAWGDARAYDGTATIQQPLIAPLYEGARTACEVLAGLSDGPGRSAYEMVRATWRGFWEKGGRSGDFESFWKHAVHDGVVPNTAREARNVRPVGNWPAAQAAAEPAPGLVAVFRTDPTLFDGRFANNGWLQELPRPLTHLTWDNAALMSPATARRLGLPVPDDGAKAEWNNPRTEVVELSLPGRDPVEAPVWVVPALPDDTVTLHLGYGRIYAGEVGSGVGFDANRLRSSQSPLSEAGLTVERTHRTTLLACTQPHHRLDGLEGRRVIRSATLDHYREHRDFAKEHGHEHPTPLPGRLQTAEPGPDAEKKPQRRPLTMYGEWQYHGHKWGMVIDLTACNGCSACVVACQAENNIPVVGKEEVGRGREMHWLRIDRYTTGPAEAPETHLQPMLCQHCETAPCEVVCPVEATVHSDEGLNDMVYNRCVGTRYCSNNCPYKVRRFNFLQYNDWTNETLKLLRNPDVTVRSRGVMEKCTYCTQRISAARIEAEKEGRKVRDGEVITACQAACPAGAILFGDLNDEKARVTRAHKSDLNYALLAELNTAPRTTYLAELRNPNPELSGAKE
jgi:Fe-S-cluster-containing dehydrogenase component